MNMQASRRKTSLWISSPLNKLGEQDIQLHGEDGDSAVEGKVDEEDEEEGPDLRFVPLFLSPKLS